MLQRRALLAGLLAFGLPAWAEAPLTSPRPRRRGEKEHVPQADVADLLAEAKLGGVVGYVVANAATGTVIEAEGADVPVPPASVAKVITAMFALEKLGPAHRFTTRVLATGPVVAGIVQGDVVLAGGGDPTLDTDRLGDLVARLAIKGVTGRFLVWGGALPEIMQIDGDQPEYVGYNPAISGLNLNFNRVNFEWKRVSGDYRLSMDARGERFVPLVDMASVRLDGREAPLFVYEGAPGRDDWSVAKGALGKDGSRWLPVRNPAIYAGDVFRTLARAQGIVLPRAEVVGVLPEGTVIGQDQSADLVTVLRDMLKFSTNLTAEIMGLSSTGLPTLAASAAVMTEWAQTMLGLTSHFVDHSGLEPASRVSAGDLVRALVASKSLTHGNLLRGILRDVGMRDAAGKDIPDHPVKVRAKSGTLNFVSGLAGFIQPPGGTELAFAVFCADTARRDALPLAERELPEGGKAWVKRARRLQGRLITRWAGLYA
jgi:serine-type D-Ala-D-Ala carboxypeptidase/endopeptidase (penicillin-binding protein 4)